MSLLWYLLAGAAALVAGGIIIHGIINASRLREQLEAERAEEGRDIYYKITALQPNKVSVNKYNRNGYVEEKEFESNEGVSRDLRVGQYIR